jgi:hypothetical protein
MTLGLANAYGPQVRPCDKTSGPFHAHISHTWDNDPFGTTVAQRIFQRRGGQPDGIVGVAFNLASTASMLCTKGAVVRVDGRAAMMPA